MRRNVENKKNNPVNITFVDKTSDIRNSSENITSVHISEVATLVSMIPNFWCSLEVAAAELHLCFVIKVTFVETHFSSDGYGYYRCVKPFTPHITAWSVKKGFNPGLPCWPSWARTGVGLKKA